MITITHTLAHYLRGVSSAALIINVFPIMSFSMPGTLVASSLPVQYQDTSVLRFTLVGPDLNQYSQDRAGITPQRDVATLDIPAEFIIRRDKALNLPFHRGPLTDRETNIPIAVFYPSMRGGSNNPYSEMKLEAIIQWSYDSWVRKGIQSQISLLHLTPADNLNVNDLCVYLVPDSPGYAGNEFYFSCDVTDQNYSILCFKPVGEQRLCQEIAYVTSSVGVQLFYDARMLKEHSKLLGAFRELVRSFIE